MNTDRLEEFIKSNREEFDELEPSPKVWENIRTGTAPKRKHIHPVFFRVAAVAVILLLAATVVWRSSLFGNREQLADDPELRELMEAESYYAREVDSKLQEIRKCYYTYPGLKQDVEGDLNELEEMYNDLKHDLRENVSNKTVIEAMIENNRYRLKLVDDVLEQINC